MQILKIIIVLINQPIFTIKYIQIFLLQISPQMLRRVIKFCCSESAGHLRQMLRKCQTLEQQIGVTNQKLASLREQVKAEQKKLSQRNKQIHQLRSQLTNDVMKGQQYMSSARKKAQAHKKQSIQNFAQGLTSIDVLLKQIKNIQNQTVDADLKQGFDLTSRLFFNTLQKYKILPIQPQLKTKFNKDQMIAQGEVKAENQKDRGTIAKVIQQGYKAQGKVIHKAKVQVYV